MAKLPEDKIAQVRQAADIVEIVSESVVLKRSGKNYQGLCPFHTEKTPSFTVSPDKQIYYCFGCQSGGNVFRFLMNHEGLSFPEAVRKVAVRYGVPLPEPRMSPEQKRRWTEREALLRVNREAAAYFRQQLRRPQSGDAALAYLRGRGFSDTVIDRFELGYAPPGWDRLIGHLARRRFSRELMEKAGLVIPRKSGTGFYDRFRDRVIFPIHDTGGQVVGFGGRVRDDTVPKYLNSPETPVYRKRRVLYGAHLARSACRAAGRVFVVEGYLDLLALHQFGFQDAVATLGTALTAEHVHTLRGLVGEEGRVILVYDSDDAGIEAARRSIAVFDRGYVDAHILVLPAGHDPDTFLHREGGEAFEKQVEEAHPMIPFVISSAVQRHGTTPKGKTRIVREVQPVISSVQDRVERSLYIKELAERIGVREADLFAELRRTRMPAAPSSRPAHRPQPDRHERQIVAMMVHLPEILPVVASLDPLPYFRSGELKRIAEAILRQPDSPIEALDAIVSENDGPAARLAAELAVAEGSFSYLECDRMLHRFVENRRKTDDFRRIDSELKEAEQAQDDERVLQLLAEKQKLAEALEKNKSRYVRSAPGQT